MTVLKINDFDLFEVLVCMFAWTTLYFVLCLWNSKRSYEWHCRIVTTLHAVVISSLAIYCTFRVGPWPFTEAGGPNTPLQIRIVGLCLGYFIFDIAWCLYFNTEGPAMLAHHILSIVGTSWCLFGGYLGTELVATIGGAEITNPLLQLRWFLRETGKYNSALGDVVDLAFMFTFAFFRIGFGSALLYSYFQQDTDFWGRFGGVCIYVIGWIFFINILSYAHHKYTRRYRLGTRSHTHSPAQNHQNKTASCRVKDRPDIIEEQDIPSQSEIKYGNRELILRKNGIVQGSIKAY